MALGDVRFGSFATGSSQQQVVPCPLCPDSDQILHLSEMTLRAINGLMHRSNQHLHSILFDHLVGARDELHKRQYFDLRQ
jgi:hypothetical protein